MSAVADDYRHSSKLIQPSTSITLGDSVLKWYDLAPADEPVPPDVQVLARGSLHAAGESGLGLADDLGFVILHRCGESFYFLLVSTWRNDNEVWQTVWAKAARTSPSGRGRAKERIWGPSACGSSGSSGTSSRPGAASCARSVAPPRARPICTTRSKARSEPDAQRVSRAATLAG